jgi:hypothetical protein
MICLNTLHRPTKAGISFASISHNITYFLRSRLNVIVHSLSMTFVHQAALVTPSELHVQMIITYNFVSGYLLSKIAHLHIVLDCCVVHMLTYILCFIAVWSICFNWALVSRHLKFMFLPQSKRPHCRNKKQRCKIIVSTYFLYNLVCWQRICLFFCMVFTFSLNKWMSTA